MFYIKSENVSPTSLSHDSKCDGLLAQMSTTLSPMVDCLKCLFASHFTTPAKSVVEESDGAQVR